MRSHDDSSLLLSIFITAALLLAGTIFASSQLLSYNTAKAFTNLFQAPNSQCNTVIQAGCGGTQGGAPLQVPEPTGIAIPSAIAWKTGAFLGSFGGTTIYDGGSIQSSENKSLSFNVKSGDPYQDRIIGCWLDGKGTKTPVNLGTDIGPICRMLGSAIILIPPHGQVATKGIALKDTLTSPWMHVTPTKHSLVLRFALVEPPCTGDFCGFSALGGPPTREASFHWTSVPSSTAVNQSPSPNIHSPNNLITGDFQNPKLQYLFNKTSPSLFTKNNPGLVINGLEKGSQNPKLQYLFNKTSAVAQTPFGALPSGAAGSSFVPRIVADIKCLPSCQVYEGNAVTLDGSGSTPAGGTYSWSSSWFPGGGNQQQLSWSSPFENRLWHSSVSTPSFIALHINGTGHAVIPFELQYCYGHNNCVARNVDVIVYPGSASQPKQTNTPLGLSNLLSSNTPQPNHLPNELTNNNASSSPNNNPPSQTSIAKSQIRNNPGLIINGLENGQNPKLQYHPSQPSSASNLTNNQQQANPCALNPETPTCTPR